MQWKRRNPKKLSEKNALNSELADIVLSAIQILSDRLIVCDRAVLINESLRAVPLAAAAVPREHYFAHASACHHSFALKESQGQRQVFNEK